MIISLNGISKYFGSDQILKDASGIIKSDSRIGIIGANGAGKTTLLNILTLAYPSDSGEIYINPSVKFGYLTQNSLIESDNTVYEEMRTVFKKEIEATEAVKNFDFSKENAKYEYDKLLSYINSTDAYNIDVKINYILNGMGFDEKQKGQRVSVLSGGEKTRLALSKLLLTDANVLILDEPTNHLDFSTCAWLEEYLSNFKGAVISVTHDRYYLDKVCDTIWELEFGKITEYKQNYSGYKLEKARKLEEQEKLFKEQTERREKLQDYVARNLVRASTSAMAKSRQKELDKMEPLERPAEYTKHIQINFNKSKKSWFDVLKLINLDLYVERRLLFKSLNIDIKAGERIAFIGDNGTGKTTLFNTLLGKHTEYEGKIRWGKEVDTGVYEQTHTYSDPNKSIMEEFHDHFPSYTELEVRSALASVLFTEDDVYKKVSTISGGESARLQLAILSRKFNNTLLLDEPTNHLDMPSKERLEEALLKFDGTELVISHDRYFLNTIPDKIVYLSQDEVIVFAGKFDELHKCITQKTQSTNKQVLKKSDNAKNTAGYTTKEDRAKAAQKRNAISSAEKEVAKLEMEISELETRIAGITSDYEKLTKACAELEIKKELLDKATELWFELSEENQ